MDQIVVGCLVMIVIFLIQISGEDRVDNPFMDMLPGGSMMMTRCRMDVDPGHQKQPYDSPASDQRVEIRFANENRAHRASFMQTLAYCIPRLKETVRSREKGAHR